MEHICLLKEKENMSEKEENNMLDYIYTFQLLQLLHVPPEKSWSTFPNRKQRKHIQGGVE